MKFLVVNIIWFPYFILENVYESDDFNFGTVYKGGFFLPGDKWTNEFLKSLLEKQIKSAQEKKGGGGARACLTNCSIYQEYRHTDNLKPELDHLNMN